MRKRTPLYLNSLEEAQKKGREEVDKYLASYKANVRCAEDIKRTIYYYYDGFRLPDGFEDRVLDTYGLERMSYVLAYNIQHMPYDGRISEENKKWAAQIKTTQNGEVFRSEYMVDAHIGLLNMFINAIREHQLAQEADLKTNDTNEEDYGMDMKL